MLFYWTNNNIFITKKQYYAEGKKKKKKEVATLQDVSETPLPRKASASARASQHVIEFLYEFQSSGILKKMGMFFLSSMQKRSNIERLQTH